VNGNNFQASYEEIDFSQFPGRRASVAVILAPVA
jgi:hypothetical protein